MAFTVYGYENNPRTRIVRIVATAENIPLEQFEVIPRKNVNRDLLIREFPRSLGKIPAISGQGVRLTEVMAITQYLAKRSGTNKLVGDGSIEQEAEVLSWVSWANMELINTLARWFLPLIPNFATPAPYDKEAIEAGKTASLTMLDVLETQLHGRTYLVGDHFTLADIFIGIMLSRGLEWVLGAAWRDQHPNTMQYFERFSQWGPVQSVVPNFVLIEKETPNVNPYQ